MKKKISLLLCMLIAVLCLGGCSGEDTGISYDAASLEESAEFIISNFSQMGEEDLNQFQDLSGFQLDYTLMQTGLRISGDDFLGIINSWLAAESECGTYVSHGDYEIEEKTDEIIVSTVAKYEERDAEISFTFDEKGNMESMDVSARFSVGEILSKAGLNTLLGMGTVFVVLIFLAFIISLLRFIPMIQEKLSRKEKKEVKEVKEENPAASEVVTEIDETDDLELIAVITAAIAAQEGTDTNGFVVRSIKRRPSNNWI